MFFLFVCLLIFGLFLQPLFGSMSPNTLMWINHIPSEWHLYVLICSLGSCFMCFLRLHVLTVSHCIMHSFSDDVYHGLICANCLLISNCLSPHQHHTLNILGCQHKCHCFIDSFPISLQMCFLLL